ncbi:SDR family NAD(P)-dependent oxidoreductase [Chromobacterium sphagni]|uniref:Short-chain dehydrogenase n=1 Tax=Chromobacterium sphagni TaxID=1903179 RepID=A0A1S1WVC4_9NEIS|nr:SDR family NAD(P)-dependent oxidoreductase [Chromobacterium sphagni]OHX11240.1 short-chain dehydrogenase [Chromobacterium sphagni]OHX19219.1 short-chain dehydrogenase [Chromobacterium sphagni]
MTLRLNPAIADWRALRVWVIGASSGIGAALAAELLDAGAEVILSARRAEPMRALAAGRSRARVETLDVTDPAAWLRVWSQLETANARPNLVVFCAADYRPQTCLDLRAEETRRLLDTNLLGIYYGLEVILPTLARQGGGVALIASVAGYAGLPGAAVYGPGKAALINLAEILYTELKPRGVAVYLINPGFVATPLTAKNDFSMPALLTPRQAARDIMRGFARGAFEIHFPFRFTIWLKLLRLLPYRLRLPLLARLARS